jgi:hypothetical protein
MFWEALTGQGIFFQRDIHNYFIPISEVFVRAVAVEGVFPVWNPYLAFGQPMAADPAYQAFYPFSWLKVLVQPGTYYALLVTVHVWFSGLGAYLLLRRWGGGVAAGLLGGGAWCLSGPLLSGANLIHHFCSAAWMPWVLLALERALREGGAIPKVLLGLAAATQALAGSADVCFMTALLSAGRAAGFVAGGPLAPRARALARVIGVALPLAALLAAVQWLPTSLLLSGASRARQSAATSLHWSLHPVGLLDLMVPWIVADLPLTTGARALVFEDREPLLACLYLGASTIVPAALALALPGPRRRWLLALSFAAFTWMSVGRFGGLLPLLLHLPGFSLFRYPPKYLWPAALSWALLVGWGVVAWDRRWEEAERRRARWVLAGAALGAAVLALAGIALRHPATSAFALARLVAPEAIATAGLAAGHQAWRAAAVLAAPALLLVWRLRSASAPRGLTAALVVVALADLAFVTRAANPLAPPELLAYRPRLLDAIRAPGVMPPRLHAFNGPADLNRQFTRMVEGWGRKPSWSLGQVDLLQPPIPSRWGVAGSFEGDPTGLGPPPLPILTEVLAKYEGTSFGRKVLRLGAVNYVTALRPGVFGGLPQVGEHQSVFESPVRLFAVPDAVPAVYLVGRSRVATEPQSYVDLQDPAFDPGSEVILEGGERIGAAGFQGHTQVLWRRSDALAVATEGSHPGYLVVVELHDRGWRARVDGVEAPVLRGNILFRAVPVPAGRHRVDLWYQTPGLRLGSLLSGLGLALAVAGLLAGRLNAAGTAPNMASR